MSPRHMMNLPTLAACFKFVSLVSSDVSNGAFLPALGHQSHIKAFDSNHRTVYGEFKSKGGKSFLSTGLEAPFVSLAK